MAAFEETSTLVAGMISTNGLIPLFGTTGSIGISEQETGIMTVPSYNNWITRFNSSSYKSTGPTGAWAGEWWSVYNYLQYGGICVVGGTGSTGDYYSPNGGLCAGHTPLHNTNLINLDVIFDSGNTLSAFHASSVANTRQDCLAFIGNQKAFSTPVGSVYSSSTTGYIADFNATPSQYVCLFAGRKKSLDDVSTPVPENSILTTTGADAAGCLARTVRTNNIWTSPAGTTRGRILSAIMMEQPFDDSAIAAFVSAKINPIISVTNNGTCLMGNLTTYAGAKKAYKSINTMNLIIYLKKQTAIVLNEFLHEINNAETRLNIKNNLTPLFNSIKSTGAITNYTIVCDETNNTATIIANNQLVVDLTITQSLVAESIVINFILDSASN